MYRHGSVFEMFTSRPQLAVNPFNPNTLPADARRTLSSSFSTPFLPFLYCMSNLPTEPISQREEGERGGRGTRTDSAQIHFCSRSQPPLAYGEQEPRESGELRGRTESRMWRALFISSLLK